MMVEITPADREAASEYYDHKRSAAGQGQRDLSTAFADHRIQSTADLKAKLAMAVEALEEADDTLAKLAWSLAEHDAELFAQEIAVIAHERMNIAAIKGVKA